MTLHSMTGFARTEGQYQDVSWVFEIKSVNGRGLDVRVKLPESYDFLDIPIRQLLAASCKRGNVSVNLQFAKSQKAEIELNQDLLNEILRLQAAMPKSVSRDELRLDQLLQVPGLLRQKEKHLDIDAWREQLLQSFQVCLGQFQKSREAEGQHLSKAIRTHITKIEEVVTACSSAAQRQTEYVQKRIVDQLALFKPVVASIDETRLAQEMAMLATKADVREELDRLTAHISAAKALLLDQEPVGRRFDFLMQEFNREANTLCAKAADMELTNCGLMLKNSIEQMREQIQNIE